MKNEELKEMINQIKKYQLIELFKDSEKLEQWLKKITKKERNNFIGLDIDPSEIKFPKKILIDINLLNCSDYNKRIKAIAKLKNGEGCWHLFERLCSQNFLNSKKFYEDIDMISKADTARYALWVINDDTFINNPYHDQDLKLIVEAKDNLQEEDKIPQDWVIADALATTASSIDSINSNYHQKDMELISTSGSSCLQASNFYPKMGANNLAVNKDSLNDIYHFENMQILTNNFEKSEFLYNIMTNSKIIKGENYRAEVNSLVNATSSLKARALYYYIANPIDKYDFHFLDDFPLDMDANILLLHKNLKSIDGNKNPDYLKELEKINTISDDYVFYYTSLLTNYNSFNSPYQKHDLDLLLSIKDKNIFLDLYKLMIDKDSLEGRYHKEDVNIISKITDAKKRALLLRKAINEYSIKSLNHLYDMNYIKILDLKNISDEVYNAMYYYLFAPDGIDDKEHIDKLEKLYIGKKIKSTASLYLDNLEEKLNNNLPIKLSKKPRFFKRNK